MQNIGIRKFEFLTRINLFTRITFTAASIASNDLNSKVPNLLNKIKYFSNIDDTEFLENFFDELSDKHRKAGVDASGMDVFGKVFCKVMRPILLGMILVDQGCIM